MTVKRRRLELPRHNCHYPLKVARLPIPPSLRMIQKTFSVPRTGLEPARLSTLAPETSASTIPPPGQKMFLNILSGKRDSNSRPRPWQGRALPTELFPQGLWLWVEMDSNHRRRKPADLQSAPFGHSGIHPLLVTPTGFKPVTF